MAPASLSKADIASFLVVDRDAAGSRVLGDSLAAALSSRPNLIAVSGGREAAARLKLGAYDIILADLSSLTDLAESIEESVARLVRQAGGSLVIAMSDGASVTAAVAAMRAGAHDFVAKPVAGPALAARIGELAQRHGKTCSIGPSARAASKSTDFCGFVGASSQMQYVYEQIARLAQSSAPVFITGESGTGKEVCAEALHERSQRRNRRFVAINCAAIPRELMEAELFGSVRGAYTGSVADRKGAAELADGGTLFLDEIGDMELGLQAKLLRFLQTGALSRVGESGLRQVDVRVICATNQNPMQLVADRRFREDLFYRLHVLPIHLPPLRQRASDVAVLARYFLDLYGHEEGKTFAGLSADVLDGLGKRDWPGNVRQLQNLIRRIAVMFDGGEVDARMLGAADIESRDAVRLPVAEASPRRPGILPMWRQEQIIIEDAIDSFAGNIALAAAALEISPSTIYRKRQGWAAGGQGAA